MRLWDYRLLKVLPDRFIISQWRECIAIKRQWEKGTLKHRLVSYVKDYDREYFLNYTEMLLAEMIMRHIKFKIIHYQEIRKFCLNNNFPTINKHYPQHNNRYLKQCLCNLQEKYDRKIITKEEWDRIIDSDVMRNINVETLLDWK